MTTHLRQKLLAALAILRASPPIERLLALRKSAQHHHYPPLNNLPYLKGLQSSVYAVYHVDYIALTSKQ